jgi:hypothetical protein
MNISFQRASNGNLAIGFNFLANPELPKPSKIVLPTRIPTSTIPPSDFVPYKSLPGEEKFAVAYNFTDPVLGVSFAYPPGYYMQAIKAEKNEPYNFAEVFFTKNGNSDARDGIDSLITCEKQNRTDKPAGLCREGQIRDVEIHIGSYKKTATDFVESENCRREIASSERVLMSCVGQLSIDGRDRGMSYTVYLLKDNPVSLSLSVRDPKTHASLIRSILASFTNELR